MFSNPADECLILHLLTLWVVSQVCRKHPFVLPNVILLFTFVAAFLAGVWAPPCFLFCKAKEAQTNVQESQLCFSSILSMANLYVFLFFLWAGWKVVQLYMNFSTITKSGLEGTSHSCCLWGCKLIRNWCWLRLTLQVRSFWVLLLSEAATFTFLERLVLSYLGDQLSYCE